MKKYKNKLKAFTLLETLLVVSIVFGLATMTMQMNWGRIAQMQAMDERESRIDWHNHLNRELINTNYIQGQRIEKLTTTYQDLSSSISSTAENKKEIVFGEEFELKHHSLSGNLIIEKESLSLGCNIISENKTIELYHTQGGKNFCFEIDHKLCQRKKCTQRNPEKIEKTIESRN